GALASALLYREFKPRGGSTPLVRFLLGMFSMIGALVFLGCPWRLYLRLSAGDWNAAVGFVGLATGIAAGILFLKIGYSLGRARPAPFAAGWIAAFVVVCLLLLLAVAPEFGRDDAGKPGPPVFFSAKGPGSQHAPIMAAIGLALVIGFLLHRSHFCTVGALRDLLLLGDFHLFGGIVALVVAAFVTNAAFGFFKAGFEGQPIAHTDGIWNFAGMALSGLAFTLAGACPGRQLVLSGTGDCDAFVFVLGMGTGAAFAHNLNLVSSVKGPSVFGPTAVIVGLVVCVIIGLTMREKKEA
ncbi:MAG: YedE family putative selenium transporter, partial [Planctomycetota bacterium]|nr:YedE family putative selenium transporter [Planctomycetota bacterium]